MCASTTVVMQDAAYFISRSACEWLASFTPIAMLRHLQAPIKVLAHSAAMWLSAWHFACCRVLCFCLVSTISVPLLGITQDKSSPYCDIVSLGLPQTEEETWIR